MKKTQEQISISDVVKKIQQSEQCKKEKAKAEKLTQEEQDKINLEDACWIIRESLGFSGNENEKNYKEIKEFVEHILNIYKRIQEYSKYKFYLPWDKEKRYEKNIDLNNFNSDDVRKSFLENNYQRDSNLQEFDKLANEFLKLEELLYERLKEIIEDHEKWLVEIGMDIWGKKFLPTSEEKRIAIQIQRFISKYGLRKTALRELCEQIK
jgi:hypothetical protein